MCTPSLQLKAGEKRPNVERSKLNLGTITKKRVTAKRCAFPSEFDLSSWDCVNSGKPVCSTSIKLEHAKSLEIAIV